MKNFKRNLALKYIFSKREVKFINFINILSILGISLGVASLICVISLFNGFHSFSEKKLFEVDPNLVVSAKNGDWLNNFEEIESKLKDLNYKVYPIINRKALVFQDNAFQPIELIATESKFAANFEIFKSYIVAGEWQPDNKNGIVLPVLLVEKMRVRLGDTLNIISPNGIENYLNSMNLNNTKQYVVLGIYQSNNKNYDASTCFVFDKSISEIFNQSEAWNQVWIKTNEKLDNLNKNKETVSQRLPNMSIKTFFDLNSEFLKVMQLERWASFIVIFLVIVISAFNIIASLTLTIYEKRRDISILLAMGMNEKEVKNIFSQIGLIIALISNFIGIFVGLSLCYLQIYFKLIRFDEAVFIIDYLPIEVRLSDIMLIVVLSFGLSFFSAIYPLKRIAKINITESLKNE